MSFTYIRRAAVALALIGTAGCTVKSTEPPPLSGPSGLALTLQLNAIPDSISQDGGSQSSVKVTAIGPDGKPKASLPLRMDMLVGGVTQDFGTLSARSIVTDSNGVATVVYTAPPNDGISRTCNGLPGTCVSIIATATDTNFTTANPESVQIRLVPPGVILPPAGSPTAAFSYSPQVLNAGTSVLFDASNSLPGTGALSVVSYTWTFGDGTTGTGKNPTHTYAAGNNFVVSLTVTNDRNLATSTTQTLVVGAAVVPIPLFTVSPAAPSVGQTVFFNGAASTSGNGHTIASYRWAFGDGTTGSGVSVSHTYTVVGSYTVQLTVTDETGTSATSIGTQVVVSLSGNAAPTATFTFSPSSPGVGETVFFNASSSVPGGGHTIVLYEWGFGDGGSSTGITTSHVYSTSGTYTVTLRVTDEIGQKTVSAGQTITAGSALGPSSKFTSSPVSPVVNDAIVFDASGSTTQVGQTITNLAWNFGDTTPVTSCPGDSNCVGTRIISHTYTQAGTYIVNLVVTDTAGRTSSTFNSVIVGTGNPQPVISVSPTSPVHAISASLSSSGTILFSGATVNTYAWDFGDGGTSAAANPSHTWAVAATYTVRLTITDSKSRVGSSTITVTVQ